MHLQKIFIENFRNIEKASFEFLPTGTVFVGENGKGKTNILEAIFSLAFSKPFRSDDRSVFIQHEKDFARVKAEMWKNEEEKELIEIFWEQRPKKRTVLRLNGMEMSAKNFLERKNLHALLFSPEDMNMPFLPPAYRRKYLAKILSPLSSAYFSASLSFEAVLKRRNSLLQEYFEKNISPEEFIFWNQELCKHHNILQNERLAFIAFVNTKIQQHYTALGGKKDDEIFVQFLPSVPLNANFMSILEENFSKDTRSGRTQMGSHRDDFSIFLRHFRIEEEASRGEIRTALLAFKLCERDFIIEKTGYPPLVLLDDVFSELDTFHQEHLYSAFSLTQCIVTTTDAHQKAIAPFVCNGKVSFLGTEENF